MYVAGLFLRSVWLLTYGTIIGSVNDNNIPDFDTLKTNELRGFDPEDDVLVVRKDGSTEKGEFTGIEKASAESYARTYNAYLLHNAGAMQLPRFGDSVFALASGRQVGPFTFKAFDYNATWLGKFDSAGFPFSGSIQFNDQIFSPETGFGDTPLMSSIIMSSETTTRTQIPMELVRHVVVPHRKHGLVRGLLVGGAIDAIILAISSIRSESKGGLMFGGGK